MTTRRSAFSTSRGGNQSTFAASVAKVISGDSDWTGLNTIIMILSAIAALIGFAMTIANIVTGADPTVLSILLLVIGGVLLPVTYKIRGLSHEWEWRMVKLDEYTGAIPQFALDTAKEIHMRAPSTLFYIEQLTKKKTQRVVDPFLIAVNPEDHRELLYLEVWDEPSFDQKRRV